MSLKRIIMRRLIIIYCLYLFIFTIFTFDYSFTTEIKGDIYEDTVWDTTASPYIVSKTISIYPGATLTIKSGVIIKLDLDCSIQIGGVFIARGTEDKNIYFIQNKEGERWGTLMFIDSSIDASFNDEGNYISGSIIEYASIEGAGNSGIYCDSASPLIIRNTMSGNAAYKFGGGIHCNNSSPTIFKNTILNNTAHGGGGGIFCYNSSSTISGNIIGNNTGSSYGGGIYCWNNPSPTISGNTILYNITEIYGGGIFCRFSSPVISGNKISSNAGDEGGGIFCNESSPIISGNIISSNTAGNEGGGICCSSFSSPTIYDNEIIYNNAEENGGGIHCRNSDNITISSNTISNNKANLNDGGGIYCLRCSSPAIYDNEIIHNTAEANGGGIYCQNVDYLTIYRNIISGNESDIGGIYCLDSTRINYNNILNNKKYDVYTRSDLDAMNNWWGTALLDSIDAYIYDYRDDVSIGGKVQYIPYLTTATPIRISSVELKSDFIYSKKLSAQLFIGDTMFIELVGADGDSTSYDNTNVLVKSTRDTTGISVKLNETDINSGIYRGVGIIGDASDDTIDIIGALQGDVIKIFSAVDTSICDSANIFK